MSNTFEMEGQRNNNQRTFYRSSTYVNSQDRQGRNYNKDSRHANDSTNDDRKQGNYNDTGRGERRYHKHRYQQDDSQQDQSDNYRDRSFNNSQTKYKENNEGLVIWIDSNKIGKLIGKGGSKIKELQERSNTKINIDRSSSGDTTAVTLIGSSDAQKEAKKLIDELMEDNPHPYDNNRTFDNNKPTQETRPEEKVEPETRSFDWSRAHQEHDEYMKRKWADCAPITKNFYQEDPVITNMSEEDVASFRKSQNNIKVDFMFTDETTHDNQIPNPVKTFEQAFRNYPDILEEIYKQKFAKPSPIQCQAWPILLSGRDLIGIAQTGTGKTLAFLLPALIHIEGQHIPKSSQSGPNVLVLAPTRELALQIEKEVGKYSYRGIRAVCVYGGGSRKEQINIVGKGVEIVIATPGRLNDLIENKVLDVKTVTYLVLDEADRMLDLGFEPQIRKSLLDIRPDRQTVMTSATWPQGVRRLAQSYMKNPIQVFVGSLDLVAVHSVTQKIFIVGEEDKLDMMYQFLREMDTNDKVIIFFGRKATVDEISSNMALEGIECQSIHGGREQIDREQALEDIKKGDVRILLATDVASRGIDIEDITHVLNFDFPKDIEEYVHRVGRTGRAGKTGESISYMTRKDWNNAKNLINILEEANQEVPEELYEMARRYQVMKEKRLLEKDRTRMDAHGNSDGNYRRNTDGRSGFTRNRY